MCVIRSTHTHTYKYRCKLCICEIVMPYVSVCCNKPHNDKKFQNIRVSAKIRNREFLCCVWNANCGCQLSLSLTSSALPIAKLSQREKERERDGAGRRCCCLCWLRLLVSLRGCCCYLPRLAFSSFSFLLSLSFSSSLPTKRRARSFCSASYTNQLSVRIQLESS